MAEAVVPLELTDLTPTLLALAGVDGTDIRREGRSLAKALRGEEKLDPRRPIFLRRRHYDGKVRVGIEVYGLKVAVRVGRWKYIESKSEGTSELYDLESDPRELSDLHDARPEEAARLAATLASWVAEIPQTPRAGASEEDAKGLRALEYVQ